MTSTKKLISGAAIGTLLGSLAAFLYPKRHEIIENILDRSEDISHLADKARHYGEALLNTGKQLNFRRVEYRTNYWKGGLLGLLIGAGTALLVAPKTGKTLRGQITRAYNDLSERSEGFVHHFKNNSHNPFAEHHRTSHSTTQNGMKKKKPATKEKRAHK